MKLPDFESEYKPLFEAIRKVVPPSMKIYLVGGAVRDILLNRKIRDFDFCVEGLVRPIGKHIANELGGAYYVLDDEREMVRIIIDDEQMGQFDVDISMITGETIEDDLRSRDFTFNAMAIRISSEPELIDPLNGYGDFQQKTLRMCSPDSLRNDPMRALRAIRMSLEFDLNFDDELLRSMKEVTTYLSESSMERYRDEMFKIIRLYQNGKALDFFRAFNYLDHLFPGWNEAGDNIDTGWVEHTDYFALLLTVKLKNVAISDDFSAYAASRLGNYKEALRAFYDKPIALYHTRRMLAVFSSIAGTLDMSKVQQWCSRLAFSSSETNFAVSALSSFAHLKNLETVTSYTDVDIYRYFKQFKEGGIAGLLLFLSAEYHLQDVPHAYKDWCEKVVFVQDHLSAYFTRYNEVIAPRPFLGGHDIQEMLEIPAGPVIGSIKNALIEAQIRGSVKNIEEAKSFVRLQAKHYD